MWVDEAYTEGMRNVRASKIARECVRLLGEMGVPIEHMYSGKQFY